MPEPTAASDVLKSTDDFFDFCKTFRIIKAVIFDDGLDFLQCLVTDQIDNLCQICRTVIACFQPINMGIISP